VHGTVEMSFRVEWRALAELEPIAAPWHALAARALAPNVFYEPAFALAAAAAFGQDVGAGLVWSRAAPARLLGFFPARIARRRYGIGLPILIGWTHPYAPLGAPLIDRDAGAAVISAWLDHMADDTKLPSLLLLPYLPSEGPLAEAFDTAIAKRGGNSRAFASHRRALLAPGGARARYLDDAVGGKKRKELRRQRHRLAEAGAVSSDTVSEPSAVAQALGDFLALEAAGWKGRAGTAASADIAIRAFMETAVTELARDGQARVARLRVGDRPVAAIVTLMSGATAWCWKIAYDEAFRRFSPGVQLLLDVSQALIDDPGIDRADSCATAGHPMIDHIWRERLALDDRLVRIGPDPSLAFAVACRLESLRRTAIASAKALRDRLRGR
jgi:CelD/BcsL family acetyltransferase involved in cellulose biosynthesis